MRTPPPLNEQQRAAVAHRDGPCIVLAGPGAGKTAVLSQRAAALVSEGVPPERVLLLTFTRAASREMMSRAAALEPLCSGLAGGTFHALGTRIVNRNAHVFGMEKPFMVVDREDALEIVKRIMEPLRTKDENWPRPALVRAVVSYAANTRADMEETLQRLSRAHLPLVDAFREVRDRYAAYKLARGMLDYDDALEYFAALLEDDDIGPSIRSQWDHVMIDEYQDTNALQLDIVHGLAGERGNVMIVGDASQSIFGFRGSAPATMSAFRDRFEGCRVVDLNVNYRSSSEIVDVVNAVDSRIDTGFARTLTSARGPSGRRPMMIDVEDELSQARAIVDAILEHKAAGGEISDHAVLVRAMSWARSIEAEMTARRIPYRVVGGLKIDEAAHVKELLTLARVATNVRHEPGWMRLLKRFPGIADVYAGRMCERICATDDLGEALDVLRSEATVKGFDPTSLVGALRELSRTDLDPVVTLSSAIAVMEPAWSAYADWRDDWAERRRDFDAIMLVAGQYRSLEGFLTAITLDASLDRRESDREREDETPVTISTIHGSKGLEWDAVHLPSFVRGHLPAGFADDAGEELRLLYVALSRARSDLRVYRPRFDRKGGFAAPSEYEGILRPVMERSRIVRPAADGGSVQTTKRIDMGSRLLGRR